MLELIKLFNPSILLILPGLISCFQMIAQEKNEMIEVSSYITGDFTTSRQMGNYKNLLYLGKEELDISLYTERAKLWKGGILKIHAINTHGKLPSADYVHDLQVFDNIEAGDHTGFLELSYEQKIGNFYLLAGQHDLNSDFASTLYCDLYLNSSFGIPPSLSLNIPVSIYPVTAPCLYLRYETESKWLYRIALYDGFPGNFKSNRYGINLDFNPGHGYFTIAEAEYSNLTGFDMAGVFKFGAYYHSGSFYKSGDTSQNIRGNYGFYMLAAKRLLPSLNGPGEGLNGFIQFGYSPADRNMLGIYISGGLRMKGFMKNKTRDVVGVSLGYAGISKPYLNYHPESGPSETSMELTYKIYIRNYYIIQPDLQYIFNTGASRDRNDSFICSLRFTVSFE